METERVGGPVTKEQVFREKDKGRIQILRDDCCLMDDNGERRCEIRSRKMFVFSFVLCGLGLACLSILLMQRTPYGGAIWNPKDETTIAVIVNDPPTHQQNSMLIAVRAALRWMKSSGNTCTQHELRVTVIRAFNNTSTLERVIGLQRHENVQTFIDLRTERFSAKQIDSLMSRRNSSDTAVGSTKPTFVIPFAKNVEEAALGDRLISISAPIRAEVIATLSRMADARVNSVVPIVDMSSRRQSDAFDIFLQEAGWVAPEMKIVSPAVHLKWEERRSKMFSAKAIVQVDRILSKDPETSVIVFADGRKVASLLKTAATSHSTSANSAPQLRFSARSESTNRAWYFPDGLFWEDELKSDEKVWRLAKKLGMHAAGYLGQDYSGTLRRKQTMEINKKTTNPGHLHLALAFDAALVAANDALKRRGFANSDSVVGKGMTGTLKFDAFGNRNGTGDFIRATLMPNVTELAEEPSPSMSNPAIDLLQTSPWILDSAVRISLSSMGGSTASKPLDSNAVVEDSISKVQGVGTAHFLTKQQAMVMMRKSEWCERPTIAVTAFDPLTYQKVERFYNMTSFPENVVVPEEHGYAVEINCAAVAVHDTEGSEDQQSPARRTINFLCPARDPIARLPCVHTSSGMGKDGAQRRKRQTGFGSDSNQGWQEVSDPYFMEVRREDAQRYLDVLGETSQANLKLTSLEGWSGVDPYWEDEPAQRRDRRAEEASATHGGEMGSSTFQSRKSSIPGGYEQKEFVHASGSEEYPNQQPFPQQHNVPRTRRPVHPPFLPPIGNGTGQFPTGNVWDPLLIAELSESYGIPKREVERVLKSSESSFMPSIMRKDVVAAPPPPPKPKYPIPPYAKIIVNALPSVGGCAGSGTTCIVCAMVSEAVGSTGIPCQGTCNASVWANCMGMMGLLFTKVYKENSVICTELFRQGRLDLPTYMADSQFGARLRATSPETLHGYHIVAAPVVWAMRKSAWVTSLVEIGAKPWTRQMAFEEGYASSGNAAGEVLMRFGLPFCTGVGKLATFVATYFPQLSVSVLSLTALKYVK